MTTFIEKFHSIEGVTIGERKRNFHALLKAELLNENQDELVKKLVPKTFLESLFRLEILIWLKRKNELLELLKEGNDIYTSKIIKDGWCFQEVFNDVSIEELVNQFLPELSYSVRMKVLKKVSRNFCEEKNDKLFDALMDRYGLFLATNFLCYCTVEKITDVLRNHEIKLHSGHLQIFFKKDPNLVLIYAEEYYKNTDKYFSDTKFLKYISQRDLDFFFKLRDKCKMSVKVGTRTTKKIIELKKDDIIANPKSYTGILKPSAVARKLQKDFEQFYFNLFPKQKVPNEVDYCSWYLRHAPSKRQYCLLADTYRQVYNKDITENEDWMGDTEILECMMSANPEKCEVVAKKKYDKSNDNNFLKFLPLSKSIPILKDKINLTSNINDRRNLCQLMVDFCAYHKDLKVLEDVMAYFCKRHRNDDTYTRHNFLSTITSHFKYEDFNETHWNCLVDLWKLHKMKNERQPESMLLFYNIVFLHKNNKPVKEMVDLYTKEILESHTFSHCCDWKYSTEISKHIMLQLIEQIPIESKDDFQATADSLLSTIIEFNESCPHQSIDFYNIPLFVTLLKLKKEKYQYYAKTERKMICKIKRNQFETEVMQLYLSNIPKTYDIHTVKWFFNNEILIFAKYFDGFVQTMLRYNFVNTKQPNLWYKIKKYSHLKLDEKASMYLKQQLFSEQKVEHKIKSVKPLLYTLSPEDCLQLFMQFSPKSGKVDMDDPEASDLYRLQCAVAEHLKFLPNMSVALPLIQNFCIGDYLGKNLQALYSASNRVPENKMELVLNNLSKQAVSVRKHSLFLSCQISKATVVIDKLKSFAIKEQNLSIKKHLYSTAVKFFLKNPSQETWNLVKEYINFIDKSDEESLKNLASCNVTKRYRHLYLHAAWDYFEKNADNLPVKSYLTTLLNQVNKDLLKQLPVEFNQKIIGQHFLNRESVLDGFTILRYAVLFLLCENRIDSFKLIFSAINKYKEAFWKDVGDVRILNFFNEFITKNKEEYFSKEAVEKFTTYWDKTFLPIETFKQYVLLRIVKIFLEANADLEEYSKNVTHFIENTCAEYGTFVASKLSGYIRFVNGLLLADKTQKLDFIKFIVKYKQNVVVDVIALQLLTSIDQDSGDYKELLKEFLQKDDISLQVLVHLHCRGQ